MSGSNAVSVNVIEILAISNVYYLCTVFFNFMLAIYKRVTQIILMFMLK